MEASMRDFPEFITRLPELDLPFEGVWGHLLQGQEHQVAFIAFDRDTLVPSHRHRAQWEVVLAGEVRLTTSAGERTYTAGQSFELAAGEEHGATVMAGYRAVILFDQADRYQARP
jgi:quercetin dioxygenase-like cupin family protein